MAIWGASGITDAIAASTHDFIDTNAQQVVTNSMPLVSLIKKKGKMDFRGGVYAQFPTIDTELGNAVTYPGDTSVDLSTLIGTDDVLGSPLVDWTYFYSYVFYSHAQYVQNIGGHAKKQAAVNYGNILAMTALTDVAKLLETQWTSGTGAGNDGRGLANLFDPTEADYYGFDLTDAAIAPSSVTIATGNLEDMATADIIEARNAVYDNGRYTDHALMGVDAMSQIQAMLDDTISRTNDSGKPNIGYDSFTFFNKMEYTMSRHMPTNRIWMLNWGNEVDTPDSTKSGKFFRCGFADAAPGFMKTDWAAWPLFPATGYMFFAGAFWFICTNPLRQSQIRWT